ncbi:MAG TPA: hypothetical protein VL961_03740 [Acidimicrobiales bacterium]|nr:hypothetical protein [Acidimicrobiales bacterium]
MKKYMLLFGGAIGFLLGSKAGTGPYERVRGTVQELFGQPPLSDVADTVSGTVERITHSESEADESTPARARALR